MMVQQMYSYTSLPLSALACAREGAQVLSTDIDAQALASLSAESESIETKVLDVTRTEDIDAFESAQDAFDVLFNCAG